MPKNPRDTAILGGRGTAALQGRAAPSGGACVVVPPRLHSAALRDLRAALFQAALWSVSKLEQHSIGPHPFEGPMECFSLTPDAGRKAARGGKARS